MVANKTHIKPLTGMRGIAALGVLLHHIVIYFMPSAGEAASAYTQFFRNGYLWVDFFFILSGFLLYVLYFDKFIVQRATLRSFWIYRFARIYPLHLMVLLLFLLVQLAYLAVGDADAFTGKFALPDLLKHLFLVQAFQLSPGGTTWNGPSWSISAEWVAYLGFPLFVLLIRRIPGRLASLLGLAMCLLGIVLIESCTEFQLDVTGVLGILRCCLEFFAGMLLAHEFYHRNQGPQLAKSPTQAMLLLLIILSMHFDHSDVVSVVLMAIFTLSMAYGNTGIAAVLSHNLFIFLGKISYSIYMLHWFVFLLIEKLGTQILGIYVYHIDHVLGWWVVSLLVFIAVILLSILSFRWVEEPLRKRIPQALGAT